MAELLVGYSLELRAGEIVCIDADTCAAPIVLAFYREALAAGAFPYTSVAIPDLDELLLEHGSNDQLEYISPMRWNEIESMDAMLTIWADENTRALNGVDPGRHGLFIAAKRKIAERRWKRIAAGEMRWCGVLYPTQAHAQDADMSLEDYEEFVFRACQVEDAGTDAADGWRATAGALAEQARTLESVGELRIVGPDTDLTVGVAGRKWLSADGRLNMPDGEVFTSPVETATRGEIRYRFPAIYQGHEVEDVRLRFEAGSVVAAEATRGEEYLRALLDIPGARVLGEVAFGLNYDIDRFTRNILFDEKIGGTMHLALGSAFEQAGGANQSGLHWDMVCDLRQDGEVFADGELVWRAGRFLEGALRDA